MQEETTTYLTPEGKQKLEAELEDLKTNKRRELAERLKQQGLSQVLHQVCHIAPDAPLAAEIECAFSQRSGVASNTSDSKGCR